LLPQLKLAWTLVGGDTKEKHEAIERLEYIFDTSLSVSTPVQLALPSILQRASAQVEALRQRLRANELLLRRRSDPLLTLLPIEAGWTAVLRVPRFEDDENLALRLVERGVWIFPGSYYGFSTGANHLVLSLLGPGDELERGLELIAETIHADAHC
jgi:aspartate/methionine/tyrosine aminotransferase